MFEHFESMLYRCRQGTFCLCITVDNDPCSLSRSFSADLNPSLIIWFQLPLFVVLIMAEEQFYLKQNCCYSFAGTFVLSFEVCLTIGTADPSSVSAIAKRGLIASTCRSLKSNPSISVFASRVEKWTLTNSVLVPISTIKLINQRMITALPLAVRMFSALSSLRISYFID